MDAASDLDALAAFLGPWDPPRPAPGERLTLARGLTLRQNVRNPFVVASLRYEADPAKDPENETGAAWVLREMRDMGCVRVCRDCDTTEAVEVLRCPTCATETELVLSNRWKREFEIDYAAQSGSYVFDTFSRARNVCRPFRIPAGWRRYRLIDHGLRNPTACLLIATDPDRNAWVYGEHYAAGAAIEYHVRRIHELCAHLDYHVLDLSSSDLRAMELPQWEPTPTFLRTMARTYKTLGDPSMDNRTAAEAQTILQRYGEHGIYIVRANRSTAGLETLRAMFSDGTLTLFDTCEHTIREVSHLVWDDHHDPARNKKEREVDRDNHTTDCLKYWANDFAPPGTPYQRPERPPVSGEERAEADRARFQKRAEAQAKGLRRTDPILDV